MRIAFDVRRAFGQYTGVGSYVRNLLRAFRSSPRGHTILEVQDPRGFAPLASPVFAELLWKQFALPLRLLFARADLLFVPNPPIPWWSPCPVVVTIPDLAFCILAPGARDSLQFRMYRFAARRAARVVTISRSSKNDIVRLLGVPPEKVAVVPIDCDPALGPRPGHGAEEIAGRAEGTDGRPFILAVPGSFIPHKGMGELVEAYLSLPPSVRGGHRLVIVGKREGPVFESLLGTIASHGARDDIVITGYVPDETLRGYYSAASLLVFPSKYEGFGLPPLEAMRCGVPVVTSRVSSLPEVTGEAAEYVDPNDPASIRDGIVKVLANPARRLELIAAGRKRARLFSWEKSCRLLEAVFEEVVR